MAMKNFFEVLGLDFDPPDNIKKIKSAFEDWKKRLTVEQNTTVDAQRRNEIAGEIDSMNNIMTAMVDNPQFRQIQARELKEQRVNQLREYIAIIRKGAGGTLQVTRAQMKNVGEKLRLGLPTVEATYKEEGFEIKNPRNKTSIIKLLNDFFMSDNVMNDLSKNFTDFQTFTDFKRYPWAKEVNNLYELAYELDGRGANAQAYRTWSIEELSEIFKFEEQQLAGGITYWNSIKNILSIAQNQVFDTNENKYRYNHSVDLESLNDFFRKIKTAPDIFKHDGYFADQCIKTIQDNNALRGVINRYELAAALYNKYAGLLNDPYESADNPNETVFYISCDNCHTYTQFRTREAAQKARCPACGEGFYSECPNCHKLIPSSSEECDYCKFKLGEVRRLSDYIKQANEMLAIIEEAKTAGVDVQIINIQTLMTKVFELVAKARLVNANDPRLKSLEDRISKLVKVQKQKELENWANSELPALSVAPDKAVSKCLEIINTLQRAGIRHYRPVLERLRLIKPKAPISISAVIKEPPTVKSAKGAAIVNKINVTGKVQENYEEVKLVCNITWQPANDLGVKYQLIRKIGGIPQNNKDGELLIDKTEKLEYEDKNIITGLLYGYAVFATRMETMSSPATCEVVHYSDIEENKLIARAGEDGFCHFSWTLPSKNCLGVRILRMDSEGDNVVVDWCHRELTYVDKLVKSKQKYNYRFQCVYESATGNEVQERNVANGVWKANRKYEYSEGLTVTLMPEKPPVELQNITYRVVNDRVIFNWRSTGEFTVLFHEIKNTQLNLDLLKKPGNRIELSRLPNILGSNKVLARGDSRNQTCEFKLNGEFYKIAIISATQTLGVICDIVNIANVTPCTVNMDKTSIDDGKLKIILDRLPDKLMKIYYAVTTKNTRGRLYMTAEDAKENRMRSIFAKKYELDRVIIIPSPPPTELYLTVIGEYKMSDGSTVFSEPSTEIINNRPKAEIVYWLEWASSGVFKKTLRAKNCKLIVETEAEYTPTLYLAYNKNGGTNIELDEPSTIKIRMIPSSETGFLGGHQEFPLDNAIWENVAAGTVIKLLPSKKDAKHFDIRPARPDSLRVPQK